MITVVYFLLSIVFFIIIVVVIKVILKVFDWIVDKTVNNNRWRK